jgi:drug/metabolite transporter (DMT)-like permease
MRGRLRLRKNAQSLKLLSSEQPFITEGVRAMFLSTLAFGFANVFVKEVSHIPAMEVVFFRCSIATVFCLIGLHRANADWKGSSRKLLLLRGGFGTMALFFFFTTLQNIPLASAVTIQYLSPIFTSIIAIFVLREKMKSFQWLFYGLAFAGVLLVQKFDPRVSLFYLTLGVLSAICSGFAYNFVRSLRGREHPLTVVLHFQAIGAIAGFISIFFEWKTPVGIDWLWLLLVGIFSQLGQIFLTNALQKERAASVSIINYSGLIYAIVIGWFVFGETLGLTTAAGMALVVAGVILSVIYNNRRPATVEMEVT